MKFRGIMMFLVIVLLIGIIGCTSITSTTTTSLTETSSTTITTTTTMPSTTETTISLTYSLSELQADFDQFIGYVRYNPQIFTDKEALENIITSQRELLYDGMSQLEFYRVLAIVNAAIRCGHSNIQVPDNIYLEVFGSNTYPVDVRLIDSKLVVIEVKGDTDLEIGDEITSIDGVSISNLTIEMMQYLTADGEGLSLKNRVLSENYFSYYNLFLGTSGPLEINYIEYSSETSKSEHMLRNTPGNSTYEDFVAYEAYYDTDYAIMTLRTFSPYGIYSITGFYNFFDTFFTEIESRGINKIILDLRGNGGGDPRVASRLFSYLEATPQPYFAESSPEFYTGLKSEIPLSEPHYDGDLYVLINAYCFSTCGHFVALLKYHNIGTLIGEETNGGFLCTDSSVGYRLKNSKINLRSSKVAWAVAVEGLPLGRGTSPDIEVVMSLEDYRLGIDRALQTALDQIAN
ncbi:MAG: hypothetical protein CVV56_03480 [Tenericutes bacterium HGW-Tenericutes-1]|jgi:C-terminal processing protease CtpA/Prc|nr:MAG: hypothetical protein CVV56_03480 [Tenericutes bacterium HGW-Tenericutes-1]